MPALQLTGKMPILPWLIGYSGGADSTVLLHLLHQMRAERSMRIIVCHLNHGLRGEESDRDAEFCREQAELLGLEFELANVSIYSVAKERGESLETAGRRARREFFATMAQKHGATGVFLAHHADDQAETVFLNVLRGTGLNGLSGMNAKSEMRSAECGVRNEGVEGEGSLTILRPLLGFRRAELRAIAESEGWPFVEDSSNADSGPRRNLVRLEQLPMIAERFGRDPVPGLLRLAEISRAEEDYLNQVAVSSLENCRDHSTPEKLHLPTFSKLHLALQRRVLRLWLREAGVPNVGFDEVEAVRAIADPTHETWNVNLPGGFHARRKAGRLSVSKPDAEGPA